MIQEGDTGIFKEYDQMVEALKEMEKDVRRLRRGQKACAPRLRRALRSLKDLAHQGRKSISAAVNADK